MHLKRNAVRVILVALGAACSKAAPPAPPKLPPTPVGVVEVAPATMPQAFEFVGQVQPLRRVEVRSRVEGIIVDRPFVEGSFVQKGQILYRLDQVRYEAAYRTALARLENAKRTLTRLELGARVTGPAELLTTIDELNQVYVTFHPSSQQLIAWQQVWRITTRNMSRNTAHR